MTLRTDLTALLAEAGLGDVDIDEAVADEHVRTNAYFAVLAVVAARSRDGDRALVAVIARDPEPLVSKTVVVELVDTVAMTADDPADFRRWATGLTPEIDRLPDRDFVHRRIHDWTLYLTVETGRTPSAAEMAGATHWMQRKLAAESTSPPVLALLAETGGTRKIRNIAGTRARGQGPGDER